MRRSYVLMALILLALGAFARSSTARLGGQKILVHMVVNEEDSNLEGAPGEQALIHRIYLVDLTDQKILAEMAIGSYARVFLSNHSQSVWVAQREGADQKQTRVREFDLPGLQSKTDFTAQLIMNPATDSEGRFTPDRQIAVLGRDHIILAGSLTSESPATRDLVSIDISRKGSSVTKLTTLGGLHIDIAGVLNLDARSALALFGNGDGLSIRQKGRDIASGPSTGLTPLTFDGEVHESVQVADFDPKSGNVIAVTTTGNLLKGIPGAQKTAAFNVQASAPEHLSIDPAGATAGIRYRKDIENNLHAIAVVDLSSGNFTQVDVTSDGAILQLDTSKTLFADGAAIKQIDTTNPNNPTTQEVFRFTGVPVKRMLRILPLPH